MLSRQTIVNGVEKAAPNNFDFYCEPALRRLAAFRKFDVIHSLLLTSEKLAIHPQIRLSRRNQLFEAAGIDFGFPKGSNSIP